MNMSNDRIARPLPDDGGSSGPVAKRKRSLSPSDHSHHHHAAPPPLNFARPQQSPDHLQVNYLARRFTEDVPLITGDESLPSILTLVDEYEGVLQRHESMAANLGAKPLGQTLMQRFERMFDGPVKIIQYPVNSSVNAKDAVHVGWLDVVEAFNTTPQDFMLVEANNGGRVCHFWTKGCQVEVSEDDYLLVKSGIPQRVIPPQPIKEDEEKELGTLEIMEKRLMHVIALTDAVSGKARKLNHRLKARRTAIHGARNNVTHPAPNGGHMGPPRLTNGTSGSTNGDRTGSNHGSKLGFVAVNSDGNRPSTNGVERYTEQRDSHSSAGVSPSTREDLLRRFRSVKEARATPSPSQTQMQGQTKATSPGRPSVRTVATPPLHASKPSSKNRKSAANTSSMTEHISTPTSGLTPSTSTSGSAVPIPSTPASLLPPSTTPSHSAKASSPVSHSHSSSSTEDGGPFRAQMITRMELLDKGGRIDPPCDRCRRLRMSCYKNLTACMGCTRKHAKCSWRDVRAWEVEDGAHRASEEKHGEADEHGGRRTHVAEERRTIDHEDGNGAGHAHPHGAVHRNGKENGHAHGDGVGSNNPPSQSNGTKHSSTTNGLPPISSPRTTSHPPSGHFDSPPLPRSPGAPRSPLPPPRAGPSHSPSAPRMANFPTSPSRGPGQAVSQGPNSGPSPSAGMGMVVGSQGRSPREY
ncbi:MAG: hypothetical protein M1817_001001 [Caeruleum heppii]|nr:MAG: hypothetical protein M1817_001001 [Caeruleum heppii]